ncbi:MAG: 50S ribosomal protein L17 [Candidatus Omnitrophica bacterium CG11_big_fil_rev_8_21_14_0_20_42_13]|uniref:50S ribosomal protein L17 n=1 Tax=Candidatus Ghiorseimicrobium undicola TaxID=1974746 RepID=A0A2H0LXE8_9BACT|nr:MAG: 50S ribosomal protein L17 [Candidatus Omnitrophica bacterium CG11_big_fil_rev_8_21_14_0_20_42_13]
MRHRIKKSRLSLSISKRKALIKALAKSVIIKGKINTTKERAKNVRGLVEQLISLGKEGSLSSRRNAYRTLQNHALVAKLFNEIAPRFNNRAGGYTRIVLSSRRRGDGVGMCFLELTEMGVIKKEPLVKLEAKKKKQQIKADLAVPKKEELAKKAPEQKAKAPVEEKPHAAPEENKKHIEKEADKKPQKKFLGGLRKLFKKERDSL